MCTRTSTLTRTRTCKRRVLVTGGSGLVGGRCALAFEAAGYDVVATHKSFPTETPATVYFNCSDLADRGNFDARGFGPDVVVHCAAMTNVDECEASPGESRAHNVGATDNMIALCRETGADTLVYMSTDYVFDGASGPYAEADEAQPQPQPQPLSVYGRHKLEAEAAVLAANTSNANANANADPSASAPQLRTLRALGGKSTLGRRRIEKKIVD